MVHLSQRKVCVSDKVGLFLWLLLQLVFDIAGEAVDTEPGLASMLALEDIFSGVAVAERLQSMGVLVSRVGCDKFGEEDD